MLVTCLNFVTLQYSPFTARYGDGRGGVKEKYTMSRKLLMCKNNDVTVSLQRRHETTYNGSLNRLWTYQAAFSELSELTWHASKKRAFVGVLKSQILVKFSPISQLSVHILAHLSVISRLCRSATLAIDDKTSNFSAESNNFEQFSAIS